MTHFGNASELVDYYRNPEARFQKSEIEDFFDCSMAQQYYVLAMNLSKDKEFQAKCCFMASKCEQNSFYINVLYQNDGYLSDDDERIAKGRYRTFFKLLKEKFRDTKYYDEVIAECSYFSAYAKH